MTNADQPEDISARFNDIDERLEQLGDELDLIRTIQNANRRELRTNSQTAVRLERTVTRLSDIARDHQQALRIVERNAERDRQAFQTEIRLTERNAERDRQAFQAEIRRTWEYLLGQSGNGSSPPST